MEEESFVEEESRAIVVVAEFVGDERRGGEEKGEKSE